MLNLVDITLDGTVYKYSNQPNATYPDYAPRLDSTISEIDIKAADIRRGSQQQTFCRVWLSSAVQARYSANHPTVQEHRNAGRRLIGATARFRRIDPRTNTVQYDFTGIISQVGDLAEQYTRLVIQVHVNIDPSILLPPQRILDFYPLADVPDKAAVAWVFGHAKKVRLYPIANDDVVAFRAATTDPNDHAVAWHITDLPATTFAEGDYLQYEIALGELHTNDAVAAAGYQFRSFLDVGTAATWLSEVANIADQNNIPPDENRADAAPGVFHIRVFQIPAAWDGMALTRTRLVGQPGQQTPGTLAADPGGFLAYVARARLFDATGTAKLEIVQTNRTYQGYGSDRAEQFVLDAGTDRVYSSTDAGRTWNAGVAVPAATTNPRGFAALSPTEWYLADDTTDKVYKTTDAGATWAEAADMPAAVNSPTGFDVLSALEWYLVDAATDKVYKTVDGGATWDDGTDLADDNANPTALSVLSGMEWYVADSTDNLVYRTTDGGATWDSGTPLATENSTVSGFSALSAQEWYSLDGQRDKVYRTRNAGRTWDEGRDVADAATDPSGLSIPGRPTELVTMTPVTDPHFGCWLDQAIDEAAAYINGLAVPPDDPTVPGGSAFVLGAIADRFGDAEIGQLYFNDATGSFNPLTAPIQADLTSKRFGRNPARVLEYVMQILGLTVDATVTATAETDFNTLSLACGGAVETRINPNDIIRGLSLHGTRLEYGPSGARILVDKLANHPMASIELGAGDDGQWDNFEVTSIQEFNPVASMRLSAGYDPGFPNEEERYTAHVEAEAEGDTGEGQYEAALLYVDNTPTLGREAAYRWERLQQRTLSIRGRVKQDAYGVDTLRFGQRIFLTIPDRAIARQEFEIIGWEQTQEDLNLVLVPWNADVFASDPLPVIGTIPPNVILQEVNFTPPPPTNVMATSSTSQSRSVRAGGTLTHFSSTSLTVTVTATAPLFNVTHLYFGLGNMGDRSIPTRIVAVQPGETVTERFTFSRGAGGVGAFPPFPSVSAPPYARVFAFNADAISGSQFSEPVEVRR